MKTERIYYTEPARRQFEALVTEATEYAGAPAVVLDRTAFYPTSGGSRTMLAASGRPRC